MKLAETTKIIKASWTVRENSAGTKPNGFKVVSLHTALPASYYRNVTHSGFNYSVGIFWSNGNIWVLEYTKEYGWIEYIAYDYCHNGHV